mgnify:CR=1 FL=1
MSKPQITRMKGCHGFTKNEIPLLRGASQSEGGCGIMKTKHLTIFLHNSSILIVSLAFLSEIKDFSLFVLDLMPLV